MQFIWGKINAFRQQKGYLHFNNSTDPLLNPKNAQHFSPCGPTFYKILKFT
jgi:hypothetical protein